MKLPVIQKSPTYQRAGDAAGARYSTMQALGSAAQEIDRVTETITEISSQTNLLALNATIEALLAPGKPVKALLWLLEKHELARQTAQSY